jgi:hypothetical protein
MDLDVIISVKMKLDFFRVLRDLDESKLSNWSTRYLPTGALLHFE